MLYMRFKLIRQTGQLKLAELRIRGGAGKDFCTRGRLSMTY